MTNSKDVTRTNIFIPLERSCHKNSHVQYESFIIYYLEVMNNVNFKKKYRIKGIFYLLLNFTKFYEFYKSVKFKPLKFHRSYLFTRKIFYSYLCIKTTINTIQLIKCGYRVVLFMCYVFM